ncbi:MAG TPA: S-methyl-5-thioribose-1-phosphate isomerase [Fimbriimonadaceae bacterium]|nr:S-methyl-5-thioribose-1-phosphate isomerase [Fimbriimonadaceae bacterium]
MVTIRALEWKEDRLLMLDQRWLPAREEWLECRTWQEVARAIRDMAVRGAPAIGIAAAYGMALAALRGDPREEAAAGLAASRPTAVNLFWTIDRIKGLPDWTFDAVLLEAARIAAEDLEANLSIGRHGSALIPQGANVLTICNTGALATGGHGTALGVIRSAHQAGKNIHVYACETRPRQQGLRLTAWELAKEQIPFHAIADGAAGSIMRSGRVDVVIAGADRIAANGDSANKIGTYSLAVLARHHDIPFYIAAPSSTLDPTLACGELIPIEERGAEELTDVEGICVAPGGCPVFNPAFDVTPGELISAIVTERGVHRPPFAFVHASLEIDARL